MITLLLLLGCASETPSSEGLELARVDVRGTASSIAQVEAQLAELPQPERQELEASLAWLVEHDPYTRAALSLPFELQARAAELDPEHFDRLVVNDLEHLQHGLATHVALLEGLGLGARPLELELIVAEARSIDPETAELIHAHSERVEALSGVIRPCPRDVHGSFPGQPWTLGTHLAGWRDAMKRMEPFVEEPGAASEIEAMLGLLEALERASWS